MARQTGSKTPTTTLVIKIRSVHKIRSRSVQGHFKIRSRSGQDPLKIHSRSLHNTCSRSAQINGKSIRNPYEITWEISSRSVQDPFVQDSFKIRSTSIPNPFKIPSRSVRNSFGEIHGITIIQEPGTLYHIGAGAIFPGA